MKVWYLPIESYKERYTEYLVEWTIDALNHRGIRHEVITGYRLPGEIAVGSVLDARGRSHWSLTQMAQLVMRLGDVQGGDVVYFDDMFTPGYEALPYYFHQLPADRRPRVFARNHAQSVDPDDFTFPMRRWMRRYEQMVMETCDGIFISADVHREMMSAALLDQVPVHNVGHPFSTESTLRVVPRKPMPWAKRPPYVIYSSRFDKEKQPDFFLRLVMEVKRVRPDITFFICTGSATLRGEPEAVKQAKGMAEERLLNIVEGADKPDYYGLLASCRVQLNTAKQDFVSYTAIEASALGTPTLAPAFRSFPEALENRTEQLYAPWCIRDARDKLIWLVDNGLMPDMVGRLAAHHDKSLDRIINVFEGNECAI